MARPDSFYALGVRRDFVLALQRRGIVEPFPIQAAALPDALAGRDILGQGRTGSGKTVTFVLPVLERVLDAPGRRRPRRPRGLVLVPTRELAVQVAETVEYLAQAVGLTAMTIYGGVRQEAQTRGLERGVDVVVATPGRLEDLLEQGELALDDVVVVVLDEADLMADMGFLPPVTRLLAACPPGQRLLFSATLDDQVGALVQRFLSAPRVHEVPGDEAAVDVQHYLFGVRHDNKLAVLTDLVADGGRTLAFARTKHGAERIARQLKAASVPAVAFHGDLNQGARQRNLAKFAQGRATVLVATDIAARGIHVDDVGLVVHVDPPAEPKAFLHRSGRTARAGQAGIVVTLATRSQNHAVRALMAQAKIQPIQQVVKPGDPILAQVRAPRVDAGVTVASFFNPEPAELYDDENPRPGRRASGSAAKKERPRPEQRRVKEFSTEWWGPEPWELDDEAFDALQGRQRRRSSARGSERLPAESTPADGRRDRGKAERDPWARGRGEQNRPSFGKAGERGSQGRAQRRPRSERDERREKRPERRGDETAAKPAKRKDRWSDDDRSKAAASASQGFGFSKGKAKPKGKKVQDKDKGKPKRWRQG